MKKAKVLLISLCAMLLVTATVVGTLAYLTSRDSVVNTFTVGNIKLVLDEADVTADGKVIPGAPRVEKNEYHLIPGRTYTKDPTVTVIEGSEEAYVRMLVTINCYDELCEIYGDPFLPQNFVSGWDNNVWKTTGIIKEDAATNSATYEFRYKNTVAAPDKDEVLEPLFETMTVDESTTGEQLAKLSDLEITVIGHAIQAATFADENAAWAAFDAQN